MNSNLKKIIIVVSIIVVLILGVILIVNINKGEFSKTQVVTAEEYKYFALYNQDKKAGIIDNQGNCIIEPKYVDVYIPNPQKDVFICFDEDSASTVINSKGETLFEDLDVYALVTSESSMLELEKNVLKFKKDDLYGLINLDGEIILDAEYDEITSLKNRPGRILVKKDDLYGVVDTDGKSVISISYNSIIGDEYYSEENKYDDTGYIVSVKNKTGILYGYYNKNGKKILDTKYESIKRVLEYNEKSIYLIAMQNGKKGVYRDGKKIIDLNYQDVLYSNTSKLFIVNKNGKYGFFSKEGRTILEPKYEEYQLAGNYISVKENDKSLLFDKNGNYIDQKNYSSIIEVENSNYFIAINGQDGTYSIISKDKNISNNYKMITYLFDDLFSFVNQDDKCGIIDASKEAEVVEAKYDIILQIEGINGIEARNIDGEATIYSRKLEELCSMSGAIVENINENYATVYNQTQRIYLNNDGEQVTNLEVFKNLEMYAYNENDKWGFKDKNGNVVVEAKYTMVTEVDSYGFAGIVLDGKWGVVNSKGEIIVEPSYEIESYYFPKFVGKYLYEQTETIYCIDLEK